MFLAGKEVGLVLITLIRKSQMLIYWVDWILSLKKKTKSHPNCFDQAGFLCSVGCCWVGGIPGFWNCRTPVKPTTRKPDQNDVCTCGPRKPISASQVHKASTTAPHWTTPKPNSKILGGKVSEWHPWVALLFKNGEVFCTGTLIGRLT